MDYGTVTEDVLIGHIQSMNLKLIDGIPSTKLLIQCLLVSRRVANAARHQLTLRGLHWMNMMEMKITPDLYRCADFVYRMITFNQLHEFIGPHPDFDTLCEKCGYGLPYQGFDITPAIVENSGDELISECVYTCHGGCFTHCGHCKIFGVEVEIDRHDMIVGDIALSKCHACDHITFPVLKKIDAAGECEWEFSTDGDESIE